MSNKPEKKYVIACVDRSSDDVINHYLNIENNVYKLVDDLVDATIINDASDANTICKYWDYVYPYEKKIHNGVRYLHRVKEINKLTPFYQYVIRVEKDSEHWEYLFINLEDDKYDSELSIVTSLRYGKKFDTFENAKTILDAIRVLWKYPTLSVLKANINLDETQGFECLYVDSGEFDKRQVVKDYDF
jgi:hypothetical protein